MYKGYGFDLEGTSVDGEAARHNGHLAAAADFGLIIPLEEAYTKIRHFIGGPDEKVCEDIRNLLEVKVRNRVTVDQILERDRFHYERLFAEMPIEPRPGFISFCRAAQEMSIKIAIGSLTSKKQAMTLLDRSGLTKIFDRQHIVLREDVVNIKPAPDVWLKTAEVMGISPKDQLVFEDSPRGVQAAITAGSKAVGMPVIIRGSTVGALVDAGVSRLFFDWREINYLALAFMDEHVGK
ncbi:MAG: HAD family phosphatase [bacterium]|nr:HAD family phosphatase [bacterium]